MDIDFALILVILTFGTGLVALLDWIFFRPKRMRAVENYRREAKGRADESVVDTLGREPAWIEYPKSFFPVLLIVLLLRSFIVEPFKIPSGSMLPTLRVGDYILVNKFDYGLRLPVIGTKVVELGAPKRGDVMVFKYPEDPSINYIKRVVGLPGDKIRYYDKKLWINNQPVEHEILAQLPPDRPEINVIKEDLFSVKHEIWTSLNHNLGSGEWEVPPGHYFVMGDNRDNSRDSRFWGFVPDKYVVGRAFAIWMSMPGWIPSFSRGGYIQ